MPIAAHPRKHGHMFPATREPHALANAASCGRTDPVQSLAMRSFHRHGSASPINCIRCCRTGPMVHMYNSSCHCPASSLGDLDCPRSRPTRHPCSHLVCCDDSNGAVQHVDASCTCRIIWDETTLGVITAKWNMPCIAMHLVKGLVCSFRK